MALVTQDLQQQDDCQPVESWDPIEPPGVTQLERDRMHPELGKCIALPLLYYKYLVSLSDYGLGYHNKSCSEQDNNDHNTKNNNSYSAERNK